MAAEGVVVASMLAIGLLVTLALYGFVRAEHGRRETMDRETAERRARQDLEDSD